MKNFAVQDVAEWVGGRIANAEALGTALDRIRIEKAADLGASGPADLAFFFSKNYQAELIKAAPGILITGEPFVRPLEASGLPLWKKTAIMVCTDPYLAMALATRKIAESISSVVHGNAPLGAPDVHAMASVHSSAVLALGVKVGAHCVIEEGARIGEGTVLYPGCFVGPKAVIGRYCVLFPRVTLYEWTQLGDRVRLHAGVVLGADGFGYAPRREGRQVVGHEKIFHLGRVIIGNDVEIGANSCIDRGTLGDTVVCDLVKIDDLVMIGHNCRIDVGAVLCGKVGMAGRAQVGKFAYIGGAAGIGNDSHVGDGAMIGAQTVVTKHVPAGAKMAGYPMREFQEHFKVHAMLNRMMAEKKRKRVDGKDGNLESKSSEEGK